MAIHEPLHEPVVPQPVKNTGSEFMPTPALVGSVGFEPSAMTAIEAPEQKLGLFARVREHLTQRKWRYLGGIAAASLALTLTNNPIEDLRHDVTDAAPYAASGVAASETVFCIGAAMMIASVGDKVGINPLKIKEKIPEIAEKANNSHLFMAGFIINTMGAVGDFAVIASATVDKMPVEAYPPLLGFALGDLAVTVAVRKGILNAVHNNLPDQKNQNQASQDLVVNS